MLRTLCSAILRMGSRNAAAARSSVGRSEFDERAASDAYSTTRRGDLACRHQCQEHVCPTLSETAPALSRSSLFRFLTVMNEEAKLTVECFIIAYLYLSRFAAKSGTVLTRSNWRPLLMTSLLLASKVWDDLSMVNKDFSIILEWLELTQINRYELAFLKQLEWNVSVAASEYASVYFELHDQCCTVRTAKLVKPLTVSGARSLSINAENVGAATVGPLAPPPAELQPNGRRASNLPPLGQRGRAVLA